MPPNVPGCEHRPPPSNLWDLVEELLPALFFDLSFFSRLINLSQE